MNSDDDLIRDPFLKTLIQLKQKQGYSRETAFRKVESFVLENSTELHSLAKIDPKSLAQQLSISVKKLSEDFLPRLADAGILSRAVRFSQSSGLKQLSYSVPSTKGPRDQFNLSLYFLRYDLEVAFACVLLCKKRSKRKKAVKHLARVVEEQRRLASRNAPLADQIRKDREFHCLVSFYGQLAETDRKIPSGFLLREVERCFNQINVSLGSASTASRTKNSIEEHERILNALNSDKLIPREDEIGGLISAYTDHFFSSITGRVAVNEKYIEELEASAIAKFESLEELKPHKLFRGLKLYIWKAKDGRVSPYEVERVFVEANSPLLKHVSRAILMGAQLHYVTTSNSSEAMKSFEDYKRLIKITIAGQTGVTLDDASRRVDKSVLRVLCSPEHSFLKEMPLEASEGLYVYQDTQDKVIRTRRSFKLHQRGSSIKRYVKTPLEFVEHFLQSYSDFLRASSDPNADYALEHVSDYHVWVRRRLAAAASSAVRS